MEAGKKGSGWVSYKWTNPVTKEPKSTYLEPKSTYLESTDGIIIGCGIYNQKRK